MQFRTEIESVNTGSKIEHNHTIVTIGSCFAENIGEFFKRYRFNILDNPFGVLYNPASIFNSLQLIENRKILTKKDLFNYDELWHSWYHHSSFSHPDPEHCLAAINENLIKAKKYLEECRFIIISLGTSYVFEHIDSGIIVSNCHKIPAKHFRRIRLNVKQTEDYIHKTVSMIKNINPSVQFLFSVSPIRHIKDGLVENQLSKASLIVAVHNVIQDSDNLYYFPGYEIMTDDLRDYRFYEKNLTHPSQLAVEYIWEKFMNAWLSQECRTAIEELGALNRARAHRILFPDSVKARNFKTQQLDKITQLKQKYPYIDFSDDIKHFSEDKQETG